MIEYYNQKLEIGETKVTDFNEGSEIRNLLESFAVDLYDLMEDNYEATKIAFIKPLTENGLIYTGKIH